MGTTNDGTTYGDEQPPSPHGPARTGRGFGGLKQRIGGHIAPAAPGREGEEVGYEVGSSARIQTGEQSLGRGREKPRTVEPERERATVADATSAAKSTLSPLRLATRLASMGLGVDASMTPDEQKDIQEPLTRIYGRNPKIAAYVNRYTDPVFLVLAVLSYVGRIVLTMQQTKYVQAQTRLVQAQHQAQQQRADTGTPQYPTPQPIRDPITRVVNAPRVEAKAEGPSAAELSNMMALGR